MGLGSISDVSLKQARIDAEKWGQVKCTRDDPIKEREKLCRGVCKRTPNIQ